MACPLHLPSFFEEENFEILYKKHGQKKYGIRILALYYLQIGKSITEVSKLICKAAYAIRDWIKRYQEGGVQSLLSIRVGRGRSGKLSTDFKKTSNNNRLDLLRNYLMRFYNKNYKVYFVEGLWAKRLKRPFQH